MDKRLNTHEPLITDDIANAVTDMKKKRITETSNTAKSVYALSGTMKCGVCGTNYNGEKQLQV